MGAEKTSIALTKAKVDAFEGRNEISRTGESILSMNSLTTTELAAKLVKTENPLTKTENFAEFKSKVEALKGAKWRRMK